MSDATGPRDFNASSALLLGAYLVAQEVAGREEPGDTQKRMEVALACLADELRESAPEFFVVGDEPELLSLTGDWAADDAVRYLVELRVASPFYPYQFEMSKQRDEARLAELRKISRTILHLPHGTADAVCYAWDEVRKAEKSYLRSQAVRGRVRDPKTWAAVIGVGAALAGAAIVAGPAIAVLMPAASGLSGAAAVSAGLAQLGFGSLAAGGLGMAGGLWVLGVGGAALGSVGATTATLLAKPDGAALVGAEVRKLLVTAVLAQGTLVSTDLAEIHSGLETMGLEVQDVINSEAIRNEAGSDRLRELDSLLETVTFGLGFVEQLMLEPRET